MNTNNPKLKNLSQSLRRNMTKEERHLWYDFLKSLSVTVHRQKVIGQYIADFYIADAKIVIELDGSQHFDEMQKQKDLVRESFFIQHGITVLRYSNYDIKNSFESVCTDILNHLTPHPTASPPPSPQGEGFAEDFKPGIYQHFKGNQYRLIGIAYHSETVEPMVVYQALYGEQKLWVRPASMWNEIIERDEKTFPRFTYIGE